MISVADEAYIEERLKDIVRQGNLYYIKIKDGKITISDNIGDIVTTSDLKRLQS